MSAGSFFKSNEKVIMVVLLALIAPTFAFTGLFSMLTPDTTRVVVFDQPISDGEFKRTQHELHTLGKWLGASFYGAFAFSPQGTQRAQVTWDTTERFLIRLKEAERLGIDVSDDELGKNLKPLAQAWIAHFREYQADPTQIITRGTDKNSVVFTQAEYRKVLSSGAFTSGQPIKAGVLEELLRRQMKVSKLESIPQDAAAVSDKEVWDRYCADNEQRDLQLVRVPTERFKLEATESLTDDDIRASFDDNPGVYRVDNQVRIEIGFFRTLEVEFTEEEINAGYEADKNDVYFTMVNGAKVIKPITEVSALVLDKLRRVRGSEVVVAALERARTLQDEKAAEPAPDPAAEGADAPPPPGLAYDLIEAFPEDVRHMVDVETTEFFSATDYSTLSANYRNRPALGAIWLNYARMQVGDLCDTGVRVTSGYYLYRIVEKKDAFTPSFEDVDLARIRAAATGDKMVALTEAYLEEWRTKIVDDPIVTIESFAQTENYTVMSLGWLGRRDFSKVRQGDKLISGGFPILNAVFALEKAGEPSLPIRAGVQKDELFIASYKDSRDPDSSNYESQSDNIRATLLRDKQQELTVLFEADLDRRANRRYPRSAQDDQ